MQFHGDCASWNGSLGILVSRRPQRVTSGMAEGEKGKPVDCVKLKHIHTLRHTPPFSQSAYTNRNDLMLIPSKPKITWNNAFSVKPKRKNSQIK